jgi:hypothetical protein
MPMIWSSKRKMEILVKVVKLIEHSLCKQQQILRLA